MGGVGKTSTAIEYVEEYGQAYDVVLWVRAESPDLISEDFRKIGEKLKIMMVSMDGYIDHNYQEKGLFKLFLQIVK